MYIIQNAAQSLIIKVHEQGLSNRQQAAVFPSQGRHLIKNNSYQNLRGLELLETPGCYPGIVEVSIPL